MPVHQALPPSRDVAADTLAVGKGRHDIPAACEPALERTLAFGEMSMGFVHDFRNVLAAISSALELAERNMADPRRSLNFLAGARECIGRGMTMTKRLLEFASGHEQQVRAKNVNSALRELETFLHYAAGPGIRIHLHLDPGAPEMDLDLLAFNAAVMNLVVNSRDALPTGGTIAIGTMAVSLQLAPEEGPTAYLRLTVDDDGIGMPEEVRRKVADPFFTTKHGSGTGLGIPQVQAFVERAGGFMTIDSVEGEGSTVSLFIPAPRSRLEAPLSSAACMLAPVVERQPEAEVSPT